MVTLRNWQKKPLIVACMAAAVMVGLCATGAPGADNSEDQQPINIDVRDMQIGDVLRMLGQAANVNIIVGQGVEGEIQSLTLRNVSVETALRLITEAQGYYWRRDENVYVVTAEPPPTDAATAAPAVSQPESAAGQPPEAEVTPVPPPPAEPGFGRSTPPPVTEQPQIITQLIPLSWASAADVAAIFGGTVQTGGAGYFPRRSRGLSYAPSGIRSTPAMGVFGSRSGSRGPFGLSQFEDVGGGGGGELGGGFGGGLGGGLGTTTGAGTTGVTGRGGGGTVSLPGNMEPPVAIMSHNALLVRGTREEIDEFREMLQLLDMPQKQVEISTKWIDVATTASRALGIDWSVTNGALEIFNLGFAPGEAVNNGIRYGRGRWWAELAVLQNNSQATVINEPRVTCMNGMPGLISFETEIPYFAATISYNQFGQRTVDYTTESVEVANELWVVPQINPDDSIKLQLSPQLQDQVGTVEGPNGERIPIVTTQYVETMVRVQDGETIVLGGVIRKDESINLRSTPLLSEIPIIGRLFQSKRRELNDSELLIFVTPKIVRDRAME